MGLLPFGAIAPLVDGSGGRCPLVSRAGAKPQRGAVVGEWWGLAWIRKLAYVMMRQNGVFFHQNGSLDKRPGRVPGCVT